MRLIVFVSKESELTEQKIREEIKVMKDGAFPDIDMDSTSIKVQEMTSDIYPRKEGPEDVCILEAADALSHAYKMAMAAREFRKTVLVVSDDPIRPANDDAGLGCLNPDNLIGLERLRCPDIPKIQDTPSVAWAFSDYFRWHREMQSHDRSVAPPHIAGLPRDKKSKRTMQACRNWKRGR